VERLLQGVNGNFKEKQNLATNIDYFLYAAPAISLLIDRRKASSLQKCLDIYQSYNSN